MEHLRPHGGIAREEQLAALESARTSAMAGRGRLVLVSGEPGAGKSTLVTEFTEHVNDAEVLVGYCDPLSTPRPAGPLIDIAARLDDRLADLLAAGARRGLFDTALAAMAGGSRPRVIVFEDIHWADDLTLELLAFLARRIASLRLLLVVTYRDDQIAGEHPTRRWLGTIATLSAVATVTVPPMSVEQVAALAAGSGLDPEELHARTGGNAFFVTEVLAAPRAAVPARVADAIAARTSTLSPDARRALAVAAVIGSRAEPDLLLAVPGTTVGAVEDLVQAGLLTHVAPEFQFRHELTRQAVLAEESAFAISTLHAQVLRVLRTSRPHVLSRLAEHADRAGDTAAVLEFAPRAAQRAAALGSHREAAAQLSRALRFADGEPAAIRAELLAALSYQRFLTGELVEAFSARDAALALREDAEHTNIAADLRWMSRITWYAGNRCEAETFAQRAIDLLEPSGPSAELGMAYSNQSQLLMLAGRYTESIECGELALVIADKVDDLQTRVHALNNVGTSMIRLGSPAGVQLLEQSVALALEHDLDDDVARAYVNLADGVNLHDGSDVERHVEAGRAYTRSRHLDMQWTYLEAAWARLLLNRGKWDEAERVVRALLDLPTNPSQRFEALLPLLLLQIRQGRPHADTLAEADALAQLLCEPQRLVPVVCARAEAAWLSGDLSEMRDELAQVLAVTESREDKWRGSELHYWLSRADAHHVPGEHCIGPFAAQLGESPRTAAATWQAQGSPYEAAIALLAGTTSDVRAALATFVALGAEPAARLARARLRHFGVSAPRGPRRSTARHPLGLTSREDEVLRLISQDLTNQEIAARLVLSERTVHHHVSSLLAKLQVRSRTAAAAVAQNWSHRLDEELADAACRV